MHYWNQRMVEIQGGFGGRSQHLSGAVEDQSVPFPDITQGQNPARIFVLVLFFFSIFLQTLAQNAASKRQGWTFLLSGDFSGRIEITSENTSGRRPLCRLGCSPCAFYSFCSMLSTGIPTQIGPKAVMHFSVFILEIFGEFWAEKYEKVLTFLLGYWKERAKHAEYS